MKKPKFTKATRAALKRIDKDRELLAYRHDMPPEGELHEILRELN